MIDSYEEALEILKKVGKINIRSEDNFIEIKIKKWYVDEEFYVYKWKFCDEEKWYEFISSYSIVAEDLTTAFTDHKKFHTLN